MTGPGSEDGGGLREVAAGAYAAPPARVVAEGPASAGPHIEDRAEPGWLGDLVRTWWESRATAGLDAEGLVAVQVSGALEAAWPAAWAGRRGAALAALEEALDGLLGIGAPVTAWRAPLVVAARASLAMLAAWSLYSRVVAAVRPVGAPPVTLFPGLRRRPPAAADAR